MLKLEGLNKSYRPGQKAVDDLQLHVLPGEVFGFIGPNGAGKTTTIKMMTGILRPDSGSVVVHGVDMLADPVAAKCAIGYVPDNPDVYDRLTGQEYLNFVADIYGISAADRKARAGELLEEFDLADAVNNPIKSHSHGMKQKIVLISALLHRPPLWVLDEPLTGLDPKASHLLKSRMRRHCEDGNTVFFSTHVLEVAEKLCDRIGIIQHGQLKFVGTLEELRGDNTASLEDIFLKLTGGAS